MKLLVDLLACQTGSRLRGIGRYTLSLTRAMAQLRGTHDMTALANSLYPDSFEELRQEFIRLLPAGSFLPYRHLGLGVNDPYSEVAATLVRHAYQVVAPDVTLYPSIFEGWMEQGVVALPEASFPSSLSAAVIYDFIPYLFPDRFLDPVPEYKDFYLDRFNHLKSFDLLLAISESTRRDAIKLLNLRPDEVVNISAAASPIFKKIEYSKDKAAALLAGFGLTKPFVFYVGNVEYHKNISMALRAFARLPWEIRASHQLVLTFSGDEAAIRAKVHSIGLAEDEVVITGHIFDEELVALYNQCKLFFFPSLYEGFGLPILEAMACGAPVIASNNSSIPEIVARDDAMFDASREESVTAALQHALSDDNFRRDLSSHGLEQARQFSWEETARRAWQAMDGALKERRQSKRKHISPSGRRRSLQRIAYVSPLPPQKSGIANYSADFLPYLSHHFNIDLYLEPGLKLSDPLIRSNFASHPWTKLLDRRDQYDTVLYQMGNSNFHVHMLDLVREFPGVVVMHDFYLSNLAFVMEVWNGQKDAFLHHIDRSHGLLGMIDFVQHGMDQARWEWLMNWEVLRKAQEIIVHSNHQILLLDRFYKFGWRPLPTMIRQPHKAVQEITPSNKQAIKKELGIDRSKFVFCSFGFLADTKLNLLTLEAFANSRSSGLQNANLVFVGELDRGEYGRQVLDAIQELGLTKQTQITGYVDDETYRKYLRAADAAIQLRTHSRGETSRAVLDCLAHGIPTIVNNHGSLEDYSAEVMVKLPEIPASNHLSQAIVRLYQDESFRAQLGQRAREEIVENHTPEKVAEQYAEIIHRAVEMGERKLFSPLISTLINIGPRNVWLRSSAQLAAANLSLRCQPRILIDVSDIAGTDWRGGIQRVVKNLVKELFSQQDPSIHLELIRLQDGELVRALRFAEGLLNLPENSLGIEAPVSILPGDSLFMLDASWSLYDQFLPIYERIRQHGGKVITLVYDLIPLKFPENCAQVVLDVFEPWLQTAIVQSDELVGISQAVVDDVIHYIHDRKIPLPRKLDLAYVHLGADIPVVPQESTVRAEVHKIVETSASPLFLMVGTVEPRKGHAFALDAFDHLWGQGMDYRLCIVGKLGWNVAEVEARIRNHPEFGKRLFFVENGSDAEINLCYSAATALVFPSSAEGFGLPIVEAALHQVPTLASDIPVLREVGGDGALYFSLEAPACLAEAVINMASLPPEMRFALAKKVNVWTWKESASNFLEILQHKRIYKEIS